MYTTITRPLITVFNYRDYLLPATDSNLQLAKISCCLTGRHFSSNWPERTPSEPDESGGEERLPAIHSPRPWHFEIWRAFQEWTESKAFRSVLESSHTAAKTRNSKLPFKIPSFTRAGLFDSNDNRSQPRRHFLTFRVRNLDSSTVYGRRNFRNVSVYCFETSVRYKYGTIILKHYEHEAKGLKTCSSMLRGVCSLSKANTVDNRFFWENVSIYWYLACVYE